MICDIDVGIIDSAVIVLSWVEGIILAWGYFHAGVASGDLSCEYSGIVHVAKSLVIWLTILDVS